MSLTFQLSPEQEAIMATAAPPSPNSSQLVRITAAAGTGKTTTLLHLAQRCASLGHLHITYITFNKSAAADGRARLQQSLLQHNVQLEARTLHSCAMMLLTKERNEQEETPEDKLLDDERLKDEIQSLLKTEIDQYLQPCFGEIQRRVMSSGKSRREQQRLLNTMQEFAEKQVIFFLFKTLVQFCHSPDSYEEFCDPQNWKRHYYPTKVFHTTKKGDDAGFSRMYYNNRRRLSWYADQACRLWNMLSQVKNYDLEMKRAQLLHLEIPGTLLLVDECQDMDGCQVAWVAHQVSLRNNKLVYLVGDAAQTIYSFRGAKSKYMMELSNVQDCTLTTSWRFGPPIARLANVVLFCKEHCPQTTAGKAKTWEPYRVTGGSLTPCQVVDQPLNWQDQQVTLIAWKNVTLMMQAVQMLGMMPTRNDTDDDEEGSEGNDNDSTLPIVSQGSSRLSEDSQQGCTPPELAIPKMHINGRGENSGMKKWKSVLVQVEHLYRLFMSGKEEERGMVLPRRLFPEFYGQPVTWDSFQQQVQDREMNRYTASLSVVNKFRERTMEAMNLFEDQVMKKAYKAEEADIILTTCHAAKGMEWDNVEVCNDFTEEITKVDNKGPEFKEKDKERNTWQFATKNYGDDLNLLYVACTRAKRLLSIPRSLQTLLQECDTLHDILRTKRRVKNEAFFQKPQRKKQKTAAETVLLGKKLSEEQLDDLYQDLCLKLRKEAGVRDSHRMEDALITRPNSSQEDIENAGAIEYDNAEVNRPVAVSVAAEDGLDDEVIVVPPVPKPAPEVIVLD